MKKKLYIFCSAAMSSSMIAKKMQENADTQQVDAVIEAFPESKINDKGNEADIILLSPQIRYLEKDIRAKFAHKIVYVIEMTDYIPTKAGDILTKSLGIPQKVTNQSNEKLKDDKNPSFLEKVMSAIKGS